MVPVVYGAPREDYARLAPPNSFIHVDDFASIMQLAQYLQILDKDVNLYNEYFKWRGTGTFVHTNRAYCPLCAKLHDLTVTPKVYENINVWWKEDGACISKLIHKIYN